jgi:hypothetical protein
MLSQKASVPPMSSIWIGLLDLMVSNKEMKNANLFSLNFWLIEDLDEASKNLFAIGVRFKRLFEGQILASKLNFYDQQMII